MTIERSAGLLRSQCRQDLARRPVVRHGVEVRGTGKVRRCDLNGDAAANSLRRIREAEMT
jgi:hypothetical protein